MNGMCIHTRLRHQQPARHRRLVVVLCAALLMLCASGCNAYWLEYEPPPAPTPTPITLPYDEAIATAEANRAMTRRERAETYYERGNVLYGMGDFEGAIADYTRAIELDPQNPRYYNNRAVTYSTMGEERKALTDYNHAVELAPTYTRAYQNRLALHEQLNDLEGMAADYERLAALQPENRARYLYRQADILRGLGYAAGALRAYSAVLAANPRHIDALYERSLLYLADGELEAAQSDAETALAFSPRAANLHYALGLIYHEQGNYASAINSYTRAMSLRDGYREALLGRAIAFYASGDIDAAQADLATLEQAELDEELQHAISVLRLKPGM
jgi:tetratricopeptide (TPR) repeat protein